MLDILSLSNLQITTNYFSMLFLIFNELLTFTAPQALVTILATDRVPQTII